jgi:multidrug efflux pump subunit AcrA (membrane-fusion protein)
MKPRSAMLALGLGLAACGGSRRATVAAPAAEPAAIVRTAEVVRTGGDGQVAVAGTVRARERAALAARIAASVVQLPYQEGQRVPAGAVVVRLDDAAARAAAEAAVRRPSPISTVPGPCSSRRRHPARSRAGDRRRQRGAGPARGRAGQRLLLGAARPLRWPAVRAPGQPGRRGDARRAARRGRSGRRSWPRTAAVE